MNADLSDEQIYSKYIIAYIHNKLTPAGWETVDSVIKLLKPLNDATIDLSCSRFPLFALVIPYYNGLIDETGKFEAEGNI